MRPDIDPASEDPLTQETDERIRQVLLETRSVVCSEICQITPVQIEQVRVVH